MNLHTFFTGILLSTVVLLVSTSSFASNGDRDSQMLFAEKNEWDIDRAGESHRHEMSVQEEAAYRRAKGMMITGVVLTSVGIGLGAFAIGFTVYLLVDASNMDPNNPTMGPLFGLMANAVILGASLVFAAVGIPLWKRGQTRRDWIASGAPKVSFVPVESSQRIRGGAIALSWEF